MVDVTCDCYDWLADGFRGYHRKKKSLRFESLVCSLFHLHFLNMIT